MTPLILAGPVVPPAGPASPVQTHCDCGFVSKPNTAVYAERALAVHSCDRHRALAARRDRGRARLEAVDRTPKPCRHRRTEHQHGTPACYVLDRCRCMPCSRANAARELNRAKQTAYGRWRPFVDAAPAREHVQALRAAGLGLKRIAADSGIAHSTVAKLVYGDARRGMAPSRRIRPTTEAALLAVRGDLERLGATVPVDATGTRRRLQALVAVGWSMSELGRRLGRLPSNFCPLLTADRCRAQTALDVRQLYAQMRAARPPESTHSERVVASRARNHAAARGWQPPMWWDDADLDDPAAESGQLDVAEDIVDEVAIERFLAGEDVPLTSAEKLEAAARLVLSGMGVSSAAARLHVGPARLRNRLAQEVAA